MNAAGLSRCRGRGLAALCAAVRWTAGCAEFNPLDPAGDESGLPVADTPPTVSMTGATPPSGTVTAMFEGESLNFWPWTGKDFSGATGDPVNLVFAGRADPVSLRAALLALDGNRTAYGFPDAFPFNATWSDANGDVQTHWAEVQQWIGGVVQLQLGAYEPVRAHLRLFQTGKPFEDDGVWTLGAAHFEVMIPGTADHQVLSWELAELLVKVDLVRSGLLDPSTPIASTGLINSAPSYLAIPDFIYNGLPAGLQAAIGGPPAPVSTPVPILTDGQATILHLAGAAPAVTGRRTETLTITYNQAVPRPLCSAGPADWVLVQGPVVFDKTVEVDDRGRFTMHSGYSGVLTITPLDMSVNPPVPAGPSFTGRVSENQEGYLTAGSSLVNVLTRKQANPGGGEELTWARLKAASAGEDLYQSGEQCR